VFRFASHTYRRFLAYQQTRRAQKEAISAPTAGPIAESRSKTQLRKAMAGMIIVSFMLLLWVRAESLTRMMPHLVDIGLGVLAGIIGNSLGYWFGLLGVAPAPACTASQALKLVQIVGVPVAYVLLGGHMLLMPVTGALLAATLVFVTRWLGWTNCRAHS
jgi:hypothetical protein